MSLAITIAELRKLGQIVRCDADGRPHAVKMFTTARSQSTRLDPIQLGEWLREGIIDDSDVADFDAAFKAQERVTTPWQEDPAGTLDRVMSLLEQFSDLSVLDARATALGDAEIARLRHWRGLSSLNLAWTKISDHGLESVGRFPELNVLILTGTDILGAGLRHIQTLAKLAWLLLDSTDVTDQALECLERLPICSLMLNETHVTDDGVEMLHSNLPDLEGLFLNGTFVSGSCRDTLIHWHSLRDISLERTLVSAADVALVREKRPELTVSFQPTLKLIGYWADSVGQRFPAVPIGRYISPDVLVDSDWERDDKRAIVHYLKHAPHHGGYCGHSYCRFGCSNDNGATELTDGTWLWPAGLYHYVNNHDVRLPAPFVEHMKRRKYELPQDFAPEILEARKLSGSDTFWRYWCRQTLADQRVTT